jgi:hypothetical protein
MQRVNRLTRRQTEGKRAQEKRCYKHFSSKIKKVKQLAELHHIRYQTKRKHSKAFAGLAVPNELYFCIKPFAVSFRRHFR